MLVEDILNQVSETAVDEDTFVVAVKYASSLGISLDNMFDWPVVWLKYYKNFCNALALGILPENEVLRFLIQASNNYFTLSRDKAFRELCLYAMYKKLFGDVEDVYKKFFTDPEEYLLDSEERVNVIHMLDEQLKSYPGFVSGYDVYCMDDRDLELWYSVVPNEMREGKTKSEAICQYLDLKDDGYENTRT